jgi:hypothetical protein
MMIMRNLITAIALLLLTDGTVLAQSLAPSPNTFAPGTLYSTTPAPNTIPESGGGTTLASGWISAINLGASGPGGVTGLLPLANLGGAINGDCAIGSGGVWIAGSCTGGGGGFPGYTGTTAGAANAQTIASPSPSGWTNVDQNVIFFKAGLTNTAAAPTLAISGQTAEPIYVQSAGAPISAPPGYIVAGQQYAATYQTALPGFVVTTTPSGSVTNATTNQATTAVLWQSGQVYNLLAANLTVTPVVSTTLSAGAGIGINAINAGTLTATSPDTITYSNGSSPVTTGAGGSVTLPAGTFDTVTNDGAGHLYLSGNNPTTYPPAGFSWGNQNIAAATSGIGIVTLDVSRTITAVSCRVEGSVTGTATIAVWIAPSGTALASGTAVTSTSCNASGTAATNQTGLISAPVSVPAGDTIGIVASGSGWTSPAATAGGSLSVSFR